MRNMLSRCLGLLLLVHCALAFPFDGIRVTLLGTGAGSAGIAARAGPAMLIEAGREVLLFDCGRGVVQRLAQAGMPVGKIQRVFLTHLHLDHTVDCADVWLSGWLQGRDEPLTIVGPKGTAEMMDHLRRAYEPDVRTRQRENREGVALDARDISENLVYESDDVQVAAFVVEHGAMAPAYGYRIETRGRAVILSGATAYSENLVKNAGRAAVLIHQVMAVDKDLLADSERLRKEQAVHASPEDVLRVLRATRPGLAVLAPLELIQVTPEDVMRRIRPQYPAVLEVGYDLMVIEVQNEIQVRGSPSDRPPGR